MNKDDFEINDEFLAKAKSAIEFPEISEALKHGRGPQKAPTKTQVTLRLEQSTIEYFKAEGKGWQTRVDDALKEYVQNHQ